MLKISANTQVWITSDTHFHHKNICRGTTNWRTSDDLIPIDETRDFPTLDKMNETIVNNINNVVGQDDVLIHLGDFSFGGFDKIKQFWDRLTCKNIHLVLGNHDNHILKNKEEIRELFLSVEKYEVLNYGGFTFRMMHYPIQSWDGLKKGHIHLHGHVHSPTDKRLGKGKKMDVGMDGHPEFRPYNILREIIPMMEKQPIKSEFEGDHHVSDMKNVIG